MSRALRSIANKAPPLIRIDAERASRVYAEGHLADKWRCAIKWMQSRPGGSIWILDTNRPAPKWRAHQEHA